MLFLDFELKSVFDFLTLRLDPLFCFPSDRNIVVCLRDLGNPRLLLRFFETFEVRSFSDSRLSLSFSLSSSSLFSLFVSSSSWSASSDSTSSPLLSSSPSTLTTLTFRLTTSGMKDDEGDVSSGACVEYDWMDGRMAVAFGLEVDFLLVVGVDPVGWLSPFDFSLKGGS